jgi:hypothetical protein
MPIITILLTALPGIITSVTTLTEFIAKSIETLKQAKELTPEQEAQRDAIIEAAQKLPRWQQD